MTAGRAVRVAAGPTALDEVRRHIAVSAPGAPDDVVYDAQVVAVELVTNAWLHADSAATVAVTVLDDALRVEVADDGPGVPVVQPGTSRGSTGRGLRLVQAVARSWGVSPGPGEGKAVWAELALDGTTATPDGGEGDLDALLADWPDDDSDAGADAAGTTGAPLLPVRVDDVPVALLLRSRSHVADVSRELALVLAGHSADGTALPADLQEIAAGLQQHWGPGQEDLQRQVAAANTRGALTVDVDLRFAPSTADAVEHFGRALDLAEGLCRSGRLLTSPPEPSDAVFRRWWVSAILTQLRSPASAPPPPLADALAAAVDDLAVRAASWDRLQVLQRITTDLTRAESEEEAARVVCENAALHLGVEGARLYLRDGEVLRSVAWHGPKTERAAVYDEIRVDAELPGAEVARSGRPLFLRSLEEIYRAFPALDGYYSAERSLHIQPVAVGGDVIGILGLTFPRHGADEADQREFVQALADSLGQAVDRIRAVAAAADRAERLSLLADASVALNASLDLQPTLDAVTRVLVPRFADWAVVQVPRDGTLVNASVYHRDADKLRWAASMEGRWPVDMAAATGAPAVLRTGRAEVYSEVPDELVEAGAQDAEHLEVLRALGMSSVLIAPLVGRSGVVGVISLISAESGRHYSDDDVSLVEDIARRAAFALETATVFREQSGRLADVVAVAQAAQQAILSEPPARVGPVAVAAAYRSSAVAATVGGDLFDAVPYGAGVRLLIGDVRGKGLAAVHTASLVLGAARAAVEDVADLGAALAHVDRRLRRHLGEEDFVTACLVQIDADGSFTAVSAGHPAPLLVRDGQVRSLELEASPPLGLGSAATPVTGRLAPGERMLLFTDGLVEARDGTRAFVQLEDVVGPLVDAPLSDALPLVLQRLEERAGRLDDDLALLAVEYRPLPVQAGPVDPVRGTAGVD